MPAWIGLIGDMAIVPGIPYRRTFVYASVNLSAHSVEIKLYNKDTGVLAYSWSLADYLSVAYSSPDSTITLSLTAVVTAALTVGDYEMTMRVFTSTTSLPPLRGPVLVTT
jgi:hypothetical protein